jgi:23S rRNA G2069 N7-methylase RlmK/C1962 C5-methylase RlmI
MLVLYLRLSGLIVDVFGDLAVIASSAAWVEKYKQEIEGSISRIDEINHINWRPSVEILKEEGSNLSDLK